MSEKKKFPLVGCLIVGTGVVVLSSPLWLYLIGKAGSAEGERYFAPSGTGGSAAGELGARSAAAESADKPAPVASVVKREEPVASAAPAPSTEEPAAGSSIGKPIAEVQRQFGVLDIELRRSPLLNGTPRVRGVSADNMTQVELIGHSGVLEEFGLTFTTNQGPALIRSAAAAKILLDATGWPEGTTWLTEAVDQAKASKRHGAVLYEVQRVVPGLFVLTGKHAGAN